MIAIMRRGSATPEALRMCGCSGRPPASRRNRMLAAVGLERAAVAGRRDLEPLAARRAPRVDVVAPHRGEAEVAGAALDDAHGQLELLERRRPRAASAGRAPSATPRARVKLTISTLSNWWPRLMPRTSRPALIFSRRKHARVRDVAQRQRRRASVSSRCMRDELRLRGRDQPDVVVIVAIEVLVEVREVRRRRAASPCASRTAGRSR